MEMDRFVQDYYQLLGSVYAQPEDAGHTQLADEAIDWAMKKIGNLTPYKEIIDIGCGQGFCQPMFEKYGFNYMGIAWGQDVHVAKGVGRNVQEMDFNFPLFKDGSFHIGLMRHSLEHSPFPILTLMAWHRIITDWMIVVLPHPDWYHYRGDNHFNVMPELQAENVFEKSRWQIHAKSFPKRNGNPDMDMPTARTKHEMWYVLRKI